MSDLIYARHGLQTVKQPLGAPKAPEYDLVLCICSHRTVSAPTFGAAERLRWGLKGVNYRWALVVGDALIGRSRSQACTKFLKEDNTPFMIFIDDDIIFDPEHIGKIYTHLRNGYDVIGGLYPVRGASQLSSYGWGGQMPVDGQIHEIEYLATGFMGISRRILIKVKDELKLPYLNPNDWAQCWPFFESGACTTRKKSDPIYISEDWDFCEKVRRVGGKVYADTSVQVGHMREQMYTPQNVRDLQMQQVMNEQVYGSLNKQKETINNIEQDLSEFLNLDKNIVVNEIEVCRKKLAEMWEKHKGTAEDFYKDNVTSLFAAAEFNKMPTFWSDRVAYLINIKEQKILDLGCGIGTATFMLAGSGNEVLGWDINQKMIDFCNFKKKKYGFKGEFTTKKPDFGKFDLVVAIDVLEHLDNLKEFLLELGKGMKSGAKLYHFDDFSQYEGMLPMHFKENEKHLGKWLKEGGFVEWDGRWTIRI